MRIDYLSHQNKQMFQRKKQMFAPKKRAFARMKQVFEPAKRACTHLKRANLRLQRANAAGCPSLFKTFQEMHAIPPSLSYWRTMLAKRVQLRRSRGWRMPLNTVKIDRSTRWGNPFRVGHDALHPVTRKTVHVSTAQLAVSLFAAYLQSKDGATVLNAAKKKLRGKDLACWCKLDSCCHGEVLLRIANGPESLKRAA